MSNLSALGTAAAPIYVSATLGGVAITGTPSLDATGALALGANAATTSISVGQATVAPAFTGGLTVASAKAVTGSGAMAVEATGALTVAGAASTTSSLIGRAGNLTTMVGDTLFSGSLRVTSADTGAAATSGTASAYAGTFTLTSGQTAFTLTNTKIAATSHVFVSCETSTVNAYVKSVAPGAGSCVITLSGAAGANSLFHFLVITV